MHTVYVPADRVRAGLAQRWGATALAALDEHAPDPGTLAAASAPTRDRVAEVWPLLLAKLAREPVEDLRIDLEDGYRGRPDDEEDAHAVAAAARARRGDRPPRYWGVRFKCFEAATRRPRAAHARPGAGRRARRGTLPDGFRAHAAQGDARSSRCSRWSRPCERLEAAYGLAAGRLRFEVQVETPQAVLGAGRRRRRWPGWSTRRRAGATACTSAPTTTRPRSASPRPTRRWTTRSPTTPRT